MFGLAAGPGLVLLHSRFGSATILVSFAYSTGLVLLESWFGLATVVVWFFTGLAWFDYSSSLV
jgi:hypothetical protein